MVAELAGMLIDCGENGISLLYIRSTKGRDLDLIGALIAPLYPTLRTYSFLDCLRPIRARDRDLGSQLDSNDNVRRHQIQDL